MSNDNLKLKIIDDLLAEGVHIPGVKKLTSYINRSLPAGEKSISDERTKQLEGELRELVKAKGVAIYWNKNSDKTTEGKGRVIKFTGGGYRYSVQGFRYFDDMVSEKEKNLLLVANSLFSIFSGSGMGTQLSVVINKILKKKNRKGEIQDIENFTPISLGPSFRDSGSKWIPEIIEAMKENQAIDVFYEKPNEKATERTLSPYIIKQYANNWYLVAFDHFTPQKDKTKVFKLSRITKIESSAAKFKNDPDFFAEDYFKYTIGILHSHLEKPIKIKIEVISSHLFESWKESPLHSSQTISSESDKIIEIETYYTQELLSLLLRHGPSIRVISPVALKNEIKEKIKKTLSYY